MSRTLHRDGCPCRRRPKRRHARRSPQQARERAFKLTMNRSYPYAVHTLDACAIGFSFDHASRAARIMRFRTGDGARVEFNRRLAHWDRRRRFVHVLLGKRGRVLDTFPRSPTTSWS